MTSYVHKVQGQTNKGSPVYSPLCEWGYKNTAKIYCVSGEQLGRGEQSFGLFTGEQLHNLPVNGMFKNISVNKKTYTEI